MHLLANRNVLELHAVAGLDRRHFRGHDLIPYLQLLRSQEYTYCMPSAYFTSAMNAVRYGSYSIVSTTALEFMRVLLEVDHAIELLVATALMTHR